MRHRTLEVLIGHPVFGGIGGGQLGEGTGRRHIGKPLPRKASGIRPHKTGQAAIAGVFEFFHSQGQADIVSAGCHRITGPPKSFRARCTIIFHPGDRNHGQAQRQRHGQGTSAHVDAVKAGAEPGGADIFFINCRILQALFKSFDHQIFSTHIPAFAKTGAAHADDGDFVLDPACHGSSSQSEA